TSEALAEAAEVPIGYIDDILSGNRPPLRPGRSDLYDRMASFLKIALSDIEACAKFELPDPSTSKPRMPKPAIRSVFLDLCDPKSARQLEARRAKNGPAELIGFIQRVLDVVHREVRRSLADRVGLRLQARHSGKAYEVARVEVLEFLDATAATLTATEVSKFVQPRIAKWDIDVDTGVLRVVMRGQEPAGRRPRPLDQTDRQPRRSK
ncbi:MAG: hypothetical protein IIA27_14835, partial [Gemmatimonadetes bacterium]|nr:hypothetical protein [Gemmatimonadota bacterium]